MARKKRSEIIQELTADAREQVGDVIAEVTACREHEYFDSKCRACLAAKARAKIQKDECELYLVNRQINLRLQGIAALVDQKDPDAGADLKRKKQRLSWNLFKVINPDLIAVKYSLYKRSNHLLITKNASVYDQLGARFDTWANNMRKRVEMRISEEELDTQSAAAIRQDVEDKIDIGRSELEKLLRLKPEKILITDYDTAKEHNFIYCVMEKPDPEDRTKPYVTKTDILRETVPNFLWFEPNYALLDTRIDYKTKQFIRDSRTKNAFGYVYYQDDQ